MINYERFEGGLRGEAYFSSELLFYSIINVYQFYLFVSNCRVEHLIHYEAVKFVKLKV